MRDQDVKAKVGEFFNQAAPLPLEPAPAQSKISKPLLITVLALCLVGIVWLFYFQYFVPKGKITAPPHGGTTARLVELEGYTKNIRSDYRFIWIVVDVESLGLCWPKRPIHKANGFFKVSIYEAGPNQVFTVSLYALDQNYNNMILQWFEDEVRTTKNNAGMNFIPDSYKLDSVKLKLW